MAEPRDFSVFDLGFRVPGPPEIAEPLTQSSVSLKDFQTTIANGIESKLAESAQPVADLTRRRDEYIAAQCRAAIQRCDQLADLAERQLCTRLVMARECAGMFPEPPTVPPPQPYPSEPYPQPPQPAPPRPEPETPLPPRPPREPPTPPRPPTVGPEEIGGYVPPTDYQAIGVPMPQGETTASSSSIPAQPATPSPLGEFELTHPTHPSRLGGQTLISTPQGDYVRVHPVTGELPPRGARLFWDVVNQYWVDETYALYGGQPAIIIPAQQAPIIPLEPPTGPSQPGPTAEQACIASGGKWTYNVESQSYICCGGSSGVTDPACGQPITPTDKCCCCATEHPAEESCPSGSVRKDGKCVKPDGEEVPAVTGWATYFYAATGQCTTVQTGPGRATPQGELVGYGKTAEESRTKAGDVCRPKIMPVDIPAPSGSWSPPPFQCRQDLYYDLSPGATQIQQFAALGLEQLLGLPQIKSWLAQQPSLANPAVLAANATTNVGAFALAGMLRSLQKWGGEVLKASGCTSPQFTGAASGLTLAGMLEKYIGGPWDYVEKPLQYIMRGACPLIFPTADQAQAAFLANRIDEKLFRNWVEINGQCYEPFARVTEAAMSKPIPGELIQLVRRGIIGESEYDLGMRNLGYINPLHRQQLRRLGEAIPFVSDLTTMMVRDTADEKLVTKFGMDKLFTEKFIGNVEQWSYAQGVTKEHMKHVWRAHWHIPSPTQLFEFYHRLSRLPDGDEAKVSLEDITDALIQQDILPFWIPKFLAVSYRRLTRVDTRRAFDIGSIDRDTVKNMYRDLGYDESNAEILTKYAERAKLLRGFKHSSVQQYVQGIINGDDLRADLRDDGYNEEDINKIIRRANKKFTRAVNKRCQAAVQKRFIIRELGYQEALTELIDVGYDTLQAEMIVKAWQCEQKAMGKELSAAQLYKFLEQGLITPNEFVKRLQKMGYHPEDAIRIVTDATRAMGVKLSREAERKAHEERKAMDKQLAEQAKTEKQLEQREKQAKAASKAACEAKKRRDKALVSAADKLSKQDAISLPDAFDVLLTEYTRIRRDYALSPDEATQVIVLAVEKRPLLDALPITVRIDQMADSMSQVEPETPCVDEVGPTRVNGSTRPISPQ